MRSARHAASQLPGNSLREIFPSDSGQLSDRLKFLAGQNKILQDRRLVCYQITISFLPEITGHLSDKQKFSAGQNENLPVFVRQSCSFREYCWKVAH